MAQRIEPDFRGGAACPQAALAIPGHCLCASEATPVCRVGTGRRPASTTRAFSLIEVVLAVGIFATVIVSVIGLLGPTVRSVREVIDSTVASRLADGVDAELRRAGFDTVVAATAGSASVRLVATDDGARIVRESDAGNASTGTTPGIPQDQRYYLVEVRRAVGPAFDTAAASLVLTIRVSWPYRRPGSPAPTDPADRSVFIFNTAIVP